MFEAGGYEIPQTLGELTALSDQIVADGGTPWCIGAESGVATGWVLTDWMEDFMLRLEGEDVLVDETLQRLLLDAQPPHELVGEPPLVHRLVHLPLAQVAALELAHADLAIRDLGHGRAEADVLLAREGRDVQEDEGDDDHPEEAVEPPPVTSHEA